MVYVDVLGQEFSVRSTEAGFYELFERSGPLPVLRPMLVVRIHPVYRVSQQRYQPRLRNDIRHPLRGVGMEQVARGALSGDGSAPVLLPGGQEALTVPLDPLVEEKIKEVGLLEDGRHDLRVIAQKVVEKGRSTLRSPDDDEVG
jgi:hypothetical protein